jgi:hypothetical protein
VASNPGVHINQASLQSTQLRIGRTLPLGQSPKGQGFCFAVMQDRPSLVPTQETLQSKPTALFSMLRQHKKRVIGGCRKIPTTIPLTRKTQKTM